MGIKWTPIDPRPALSLLSLYSRPTNWMVISRHDRNIYVCMHGPLIRFERFETLSSLQIHWGKQHFNNCADHNDDWLINNLQFLVLGPHGSPLAWLSSLGILHSSSVRWNMQILKWSNETPVCSHYRERKWTIVGPINGSSKWPLVIDWKIPFCFFVSIVHFFLSTHPFSTYDRFDAINLLEPDRARLNQTEPDRTRSNQIESDRSTMD